MDGKGHQMIAPVFTFCVGSVLFNSGLLPSYGETYFILPVISGISIASAKWADADLPALKPIPIITGTARKKMSKKYNKEMYYVKVSNKVFINKYASRAKANKGDSSDSVKYEKNKTGYTIYYSRCKCEDPVTLVWAMLFKITGIKKHRGWQSHSPLVYIPLSCLLISQSMKLDSSGVLVIPIVGLCLGYLSHIFGDMMTTEGVPLFGENTGKILQKIPFIGKFLSSNFKPMKERKIKVGNVEFKLFSFAKANNRNYVYVVMALLIIVFLVLPYFNISIFNLIFYLIVLLFNVIKGLLGIIWQFLKI